MLHLMLAFALSQGFSQPSSQSSPPSQVPVRVGSGIRPPVKLVDVKPVYPAAAQSARVQGVVIIEATIGADGSVTDAKVLRSIPLLDAAAVDAVKQWRFAPTVLNGVAVPVIVTLTVNFSLGGSELPPHACAEEKALLPKEDAEIIPTSITFFNNGLQRKLLRLTPLGRSGAPRVLQVHEQADETTIAGEPWMVTDMNDECLAIYIAGPVRSTVTIR